MIQITRPWTLSYCSSLYPLGIPFPCSSGYLGDEPADLVDCRIHVGLVMKEVPCRKFWAGFDDMDGKKGVCECSICVCMKMKVK